jgi:hypothetical protein
LRELGNWASDDRGVPYRLPAKENTMDEPFVKDRLQLTFDPKSKEKTTTITIGEQAVTLDAAEANDLLEWLYQKRDRFWQLENQKG